MTTHYELLQVPREATADEIKQAFRRIIARYHPDKVHHLGVEFQQLAQERSAQLTIAYNTLLDAERRALYDQSLGSGQPAVEERPAPEPAPATADARPGATEAGHEAKAPSPVGATPPQPTDALRHSRDAVLKRAALGRVDQLLRQALPDTDQPATVGFDLSYYSKPRLFGAARPWMLARFVSRLDARVAQEVWTQAMRASAARKVPVCVFVLAGELASERELAEVIASSSRAASKRQQVTIVPVDVRDWRTWIPRDADPAVKSLAQRLRTQA